MNEPVDWDKPIELMNGTPAKHVTIGLKWKVVYPVPDGFTATTDLQGCIGGVVLMTILNLVTWYMRGRK